MSGIYQAGRERASAPAHENNDYKPACKIMRAKIAEFALKLPNERLRRTFLNCFYSTLDTAAEMLADGSAFMLTGDIPAMWLRDSAVQVMGYLPFANDDPDVARLVRGLLKRQFFYIGLDPYSNAFNREANGRGHKDDVTDWDSPWVWERKYEIDSLCYPLWLAQKYAGTTGDFTVYDEEFRAALRKIIDTFKTEQRHFEKSAYFHSRPKYPQFPTLQNGGRGNPVGYTGMTWNGYRPSDDVCEYGYLVPSNMFVTVVFDYLCKNAEKADVSANKNPLSIIRCKSLMFELLYLIFNNKFIGKENNCVKGNALDVVENANGFMQRNCDRAITTAEVAKHVGYSTNYFVTIYKSVSGISPMAYHEKLRIEKAKNFILTTNLSMSEVADELGFDNLYSFSRYFKRLTGYSPLEYRTENNKNDKRRDR